MKKLHTRTLPIPGTRDGLTYERDDSGRLVRLSCNGRVYLHERDGRRIFGDELAAVSEAATTSSLLRHVRAAGESWTEKYLWDAKGQALHIDGVEMRYDDRKRITACLDPRGKGNGNGDGNWFYAYAGDDLVTIDGPFGVRHLARGADGRPVRMREGSSVYDIAYDADGRRRGVPPTPEGWHRDALGRLWTVAGPAGRILTTYLWDGFACLGRIDGPPGDPLAAVFSLDPSLTPIRVITEGGATRIPRDAFGEGLLAHAGVPGLYGGAVHDGFVYLRSRALDPRSGAFDAPDPWHGLEGDPRRATGYRGPLPVEKAPAGPYTVCQNDPVGRTDPTGESGGTTAFMFFMDLGWAMGNNVFSMWCMDFTLNFLFSLLLTPFSCLMPELRGDLFIERFGDSEWWSGSERSGSYGWRRDGIFVQHAEDPLEERAWTFQHIIWSSKEHIDELADARVFILNSGAAFRPSLYGTLLRVEPSGDHRPFVLRGSRSPGNVDGSATPDQRAAGWTRAGGEADPVIPGSPMPHFPRGGIHFDEVRLGLRNHEDPEDHPTGTITELDVLGSLGRGIVKDRLIAIIKATGLGLVQSDPVLLTLTEDDLVITKVLSAAVEDSTTRVRFETDVDKERVLVDPLLPPTKTLHSLTSPPTTDNNVNSVSADALDITGTNAPYAVEEPLRITQTNTESIVLIKGLEARVGIDAPLLPSMEAPLTITTAAQTGQRQRATISAAQAIDFTPTITGATAAGAPPPPLPGVGDAITLTDQATTPLTLAVVVTGSDDTDPSGNTLIVDRNLSNLDATQDVFWQPLTRAGGNLGTRAGDPETGSFVTYEPLGIRNVPTTGYLWVEDAKGVPAVREVVSAIYDAIVLSAPLPGNTAQPYTVEHFTYQGGPVFIWRFEHEQALTLNPAGNLNGVALQAQLLGGPDVNAALPVDAASSFQIDINAATGEPTVAVTGNNRPAFPTPAQVVLLDKGANYELALVTRVEVNFPLDREVTVSNQGLEVVPLQGGSPRYQAQLIELVVDFGGTPVPFATNAELTVGWSACLTNQYRVTAVEGRTLTLEYGADQQVAVIDNGPPPTNYNWDIVGTLKVIVLPYAVDAVGNPVRAQMPHFGVGEIVQADNWGATARDLKVTGITGSQITLGDAGDDLPAPLVDLTIQRLVPSDPETGGSRAGIEGMPHTGTSAGGNLLTTDNIKFQVWRPDALKNSAIVAIIDGNNVFPAKIDSGTNHDVMFTFADTPALSSSTNVNISAPQVDQTWYAASFTQENNVSVVLRDIWPIDTTIPSSSSTNLVVIIPFNSAAPQSPTAMGTLSPGTVLVPEETDPDLWELDRRQAVIDHELVHVLQCSQWGQILLALGPLWAFQLGVDLGTDIEMPEYSAYVPASIEEGENCRFLTFEDFQGVAFATGDSVQISWKGNPPTTMTLGEQDGTKFALTTSRLDLHIGAVQVRRQNSSTAWSTFFDVMEFFTLGGLTNFVAGSAYGGLAWLLCKLGYAISRLWEGVGDTYPATVEEEGRALRLSDESGLHVLRDASRIIVQNGDVYVRSVSHGSTGGGEGEGTGNGGSTDGNVIRLTSAVPLEGDVEVAPFATRTPGSWWDWHDYFPATIPDPSQPASLFVEDVNGRPLEVEALDRVLITAGEQSMQTIVTDVDSSPADGSTVEVEDVVLSAFKDESELRIAQIGVGESDPAGNVTGITMDTLGMDWLRWAFDPWRQLSYRISWEPEGFWDWFFRIGRYLFSTQSWTILPPGYVFWCTLFPQWWGCPWEAYLSPMEQEASEESGDLYSPLSRLWGPINVVGDLGEYRHCYWSWGTRHGSVIAEGNQDAPGVHMADWPRVVPCLAGGGGGTDEPNQGAQIDPAIADPGRYVPDLLFVKDQTNPHDATATDPEGFRPATWGWIPTSEKLERTSGMYVAFTRPSGDAAQPSRSHRITIRNGANADENDLLEPGRLAQEDGVQRLFYDVDVDDVNVRLTSTNVDVGEEEEEITGLIVENGQTVTLVHTQRVIIHVTPKFQRSYAATLLRPKTGDIRTEGDLVIQAQARNTTEPVEICRVYQQSDVEQGFHLLDKLYIPVREFEVKVVDALVVRSRIPSIDELKEDRDMNVAQLANNELHPGEEGYILVPTESQGLPIIKLAAGGSLPANVSASLGCAPMTDEDLHNLADEDPDDDVTYEDLLKVKELFLGDGSIVKVTFADSPSFTNPVNIELGINVGTENGLKATVRLVP